MKRHIFVGSSSEALDKARHVCELLTADDVECCLWVEIFEPGFLTFEALEIMLHQCCAAVFIASPDDQITIRERVVKCPRANVMLEFGLVAGRLGRHNVAVCQYGGAELPSDLAGLTVIRMDPQDGDPNPDVFRKNAELRLGVWSSRLLATGEGIARTDTVHGYTGRWDFHICLSKWRDLDVVHPSYVEVKGYFDLILPSTGDAGRGLAHGRLQFKLNRNAAGTEVFHGEYRTAHDILNAVSAKDGSLELTTEAFALQRIQTLGTAPVELAGMDVLPEPWSARWMLNPGTKSRTLEGTVRTEGGILTQGTVTAVQHPEPS